MTSTLRVGDTWRGGEAMNVDPPWRALGLEIFTRAAIEVILSADLWRAASVGGTRRQ